MKIEVEKTSVKEKSFPKVMKGKRTGALYLVFNEQWNHNDYCALVIENTLGNPDTPEGSMFIYNGHVVSTSLIDVDKPHYKSVKIEL